MSYYSDKYKKDSRTPHEKFVADWEEYKNHIEEIESSLEEETYDPYQQLAFKKEYEWDELTAYKTHLFILPSEIKFKEISDLMSQPNPPEAPIIKKQPIEYIDKQHYPKEFFLSETPLNTKKTNSLNALFSIFKDNSGDTEPKKLPKTNKKTLFETEAENIKAIIEYANSVKKNKEKYYAKFKSKQIKAIEDTKELLNKNDSSSAERLIKIANDKYELPQFLRGSYDVIVSVENKMALIQFEFPDFASENLIIDYRSSGYPRLPKFATETAKKKLIKNCLYSLIIRSAWLASKYSKNNLLETIVVNVDQKWFDLATGQPRNGTIASMQAPIDYLKSLDLARLDPEACFRYLKGISTPSLQNLSPIRPIFTLNKEDSRIVATRDIDSEVEPEANLASMEWEDFEHLVAQLFEWEFAKSGVEVKVTQASRDRGVDAIMFDPDPLKGGKYVLQAKRYTRTVDVSAVRDLYGTIMNEGANRGILITTASFGPDAYEFAKDKPISLVSGNQLLIMLQNHGKKFRIDLEEARRLQGAI
jgi:restriction system protein